MIHEIAMRVNGDIYGERSDLIATTKGVIECNLLGVVRLYQPGKEDRRDAVYLGLMSDGVDKIVKAWEDVR